MRSPRVASFAGGFAFLTSTLAHAAGCDGVLVAEPGGADARGFDAASEFIDAFVDPHVDAPMGATPDAQVPMGACASITCGANQRCDEATSSCVCLPGFVSSGASCAPAPPGDPSTRTAVEVCALWREAHRTTASSSWTMGPTECDGGSMPREAIDDTLRRIAGFRAMVGLGPVVDEPSLADQQQACAIMMFRNGRLDHDPPESWHCYSNAGAMGARTSNLALGVWASADTIDLYIEDRGVDSLGHRRWVLSGSLGRVGIGFAGNAGCLSVFDASGSTDRRWIAWPPPGPVPSETTQAWWSFQLMSRTGARDATVRMVRASDGADVTGTVHRMPDGFGGSSVAWSPTERAVGQRYRITVSGSSVGEVSYEVEIVDCP